MENFESQPAQAESCTSCKQSDCSAKAPKPNESEKDHTRRQAIAQRMCHIGRKILVLSGKGGVGKSTVAVNTAVSLMLEGKKVGLMDIDIHGPSIPKLLNINSVPVSSSKDSIEPVTAAGGLKVLSVGFFLQNRDDAVIWRGPMKFGMIRQFLSDVEWGDLDYLIVDSPPGTGDEPLAIAELIGDVDGAIIVTTPQAIAIDDVRRSINFCRQLKVPVTGVVENMCGFVCPHCGEETDIFKRGGGAAMADQMKVPYLGAIPIDPDIVEASDNGTPYVEQFAQSRAAEAFRQSIVKTLFDLEQKGK